jgi:hypothetical protein
MASPEEEHFLLATIFFWWVGEKAGLANEIHWLLCIWSQIVMLLIFIELHKLVWQAGPGEVIIMLPGLLQVVINLLILGHNPTSGTFAETTCWKCSWCSFRPMSCQRQLWLCHQREASRGKRDVTQGLSTDLWDLVTPSAPTSEQSRTKAKGETIPYQGQCHFQYIVTICWAPKSSELNSRW